MLVRFEQSMVERNLTPATAHHRLEQALERGEFHLAYMPIRDARTARVVGVEALLRWTDEQRGVIAAADFMDAMEQTGLIVPVGEWVLAEACRQATYWARTFPGNGPIPVTVNLSTRQVVQRDPPDHGPGFPMPGKVHVDDPRLSDERRHLRRPHPAMKQKAVPEQDRSAGARLLEEDGAPLVLDSRHAGAYPIERGRAQSRPR